jgi:hypothetical protein
MLNRVVSCIRKSFQLLAYKFSWPTGNKIDKLNITTQLYSLHHTLQCHPELNSLQPNNLTSPFTMTRIFTTVVIGIAVRITAFPCAARNSIITLTVSGSVAIINQIKWHCWHKLFMAKYKAQEIQRFSLEEHNYITMFSSLVQELCFNVLRTIVCYG